jgi:hypothetical protein
MDYLRIVMRKLVLDDENAVKLGLDDLYICVVQLGRCVSRWLVDSDVVTAFVLAVKLDKLKRSIVHVNVRADNTSASL